MTAQAQESRPLDRARLEERTRLIGRALFDQIGRGPGPLDRTWWDDRMMDLTLGDPEVKVQLFRFVDALPALKTSAAIREHLTEYLAEAGDHVPWWLNLGLTLAPTGTKRADWLAAIARFGALHMARRFIAGATPAEALKTVLSLRQERLAFTADLLGEAVISEAEADAYQASCLELLRGLAGPLAAQPEIAQVDCSPVGSVPRLNLSLKLTSLTARFDALHAEVTTDRVLGRLRPILRAARELRAHVQVDMEQYAYKDLTLAIFESVMLEPDFRDWEHVGIVIQAYLPEAEHDLEKLLVWAERRGTPITVRLVKGAYWDYEVLHAQQLGWPIPVFTEKWATDACYERCAEFLFEHPGWLRPALGSHNIRSLAHGMAAAELLGLHPDGFEIQMLYGMGQPIQRALVEQGRRLRVYTPYGAMLPGMAYLVRRLLENTSNESFLKASFSAHESHERLLASPEEVGAMRIHSRKAKAQDSPPVLGDFRNEPHTDFSKAEARDAMRKAIDEIEERIPCDSPPQAPAESAAVAPLFRCPLVIGGREVWTEATLQSTDPGHRHRVIGQTARATAEHANQAVTAARVAFAQWAATPVAERARGLVRAAQLMRERRFRLAAIEVYECAKPWQEADADIAEAIDFCEFYAREMLRLGQIEAHDLPGETNRVEHVARGVAVVIPPWNFPLAIPTGMTVAALVAGNATILKPAEQSPVIAHELVRILNDAGLPPGVLSYLPGAGEEVGAALVNHPGIDLIAFTGSRNVGLLINQQAAEPKPGQDHVKRVIAEMGGKNAIIVDDDADLDEAVVGVCRSAFGYAGQKCSACSRVIVLQGVHEAFVSRLVEAARDLTVGQAEDPDTVVSPLIDADAQARVIKYGEIARGEGQVALAVDVGHLAEEGNFVGPMIVDNVQPTARIAQEEIFGPVLAVVVAKDLDDALRIANGTDYALTGGLYSRSPAHIEKVKREFVVGNLYVNRPITGALVGRQPFGGFKLSGIGTKAGDRNYLLEFLLTRTVTENTMRRGFAPEPLEDGLGQGEVSRQTAAMNPRTAN